MAKVIAWTQAYNAQATLPRAIDSILNQTFTDLEYYILDNGSQDNTFSIIKQYATHDPRVKPLRVNENNLHSSSALMPNYLFNGSAQWLVWCDADDEYNLDFLEKAISFAEKNNLDLVAGGYEQIDAKTNTSMKRRQIDYNMVLIDSDFTTKFIEYRGFTIGGWAKLISIPKIIKNKNAFSSIEDNYSFYGDCSWGLNFFRVSQRAGILKDIAYKYYIHPNSLSSMIDLNYFDGYDAYFAQTKKYLESYGAISDNNKDFLCCIYLSLMEERLNFVYNSAMDLQKKIFYIEHIFAKAPVEYTFSRKANSKFYNLTGRKNFIESVLFWINQQKKYNMEDIAHTLIERLNNLLALLKP